MMVMKRLSFSCSFILLSLFLVSCSSTSATPSSTTPTGTQTINTQTTITATMAIGSFQEYPLPQSNSGVMRPAIHHQRRIRVGELGLNRLAVFDPRTPPLPHATPPQ